MIRPKSWRRRALPTGVAGGMLLIGAITPSSLHAQDLDPNACFCMRHETGQFRRSCTAFKGPQDFFATAVCTDPETGTSSEGLITNNWEVVKAGGPGCEVCRPEARSTEDVIRRREDDRSGPVK
jgi:hypothetical protein